VAADLDHLGAAAQRQGGRGRGGVAAEDGAGGGRPGRWRGGRGGGVGLLWVSGAPTLHVQPAVIHRQIDVADQWGHGPEGLEGGGEQVGVGRLGGGGGEAVGGGAGS